MESIEICYPKNNEGEFIEIAKKLGIKNLIMIYSDYQTLLKNKNKNIKNKLKLFYGLESSKTIKNRIDIGINIIISPSCTRGDIENKFINLHYNFENILGKDKIHFRRSGINQVIANILLQKNKIVGVSVQNLLDLSKQKKLGRIKQNFKILRKYNVPIYMSSFANKRYNLRSLSCINSLGKTLGLTDQQIIKGNEKLISILKNK
ncbi:hypothetical protein HN827_07515 [archaeon]|jgi:RNase P/RNase MRP subunit p30|nr:hypothetical protein [archaeon]MBT6822280.1 hypothetical protein [archaeon]MBT7392654.1 hypothetical protein [archaeon]